MFKVNRDYFWRMGMLLQSPAMAAASMVGYGEYSSIRGVVRFYQTVQGVVVAVRIVGLPVESAECNGKILGFHIHEGGSCTGMSSAPFADAKGHYNPLNCTHPYHAGDLPPLFAAEGEAFAAFLTNRFTVREIVGKTVILHGAPDDFTTQPAGNAGARIACGVILRK